ncbi:MAG: lysyl oxidase family protein [Planctomycetota bacterium]|nr:lysyl oxidase family protein [Planctomycetota bacterium]
MSGVAALDALTQAYLQNNRAFTQALSSNPFASATAAIVPSLPVDTASVSQSARNAAFGSLPVFSQPTLPPISAFLLSFGSPTGVQTPGPSSFSLSLPQIVDSGFLADVAPIEMAIPILSNPAQIEGSQVHEHPAGVDEHHNQDESADLDDESARPSFDLPSKEEQEAMIRDDALLPDLEPWMFFTKDAKVALDRSNGNRRVINFAATTANVGQGPLSVDIGGNRNEEFRPAFQVIHNADRSRSSIPIGGFQFVPDGGHNHYHFLDFVQYRLRDIKEDGSPGEVVGQSQKSGFCLMDSLNHDPSNPNSPIVPAFRGLSCDKGKAQGISPGWADHYPARRGLQFLEGQTIDVHDLAKGDYYLEVEVDPDDIIHESDETNNVGRVRVTI